MLECICERCERHFRLTFDEYPKREGDLPAVDIRLRAGDSCGVYAASVQCPHCNHEHDLGE